MPSAMDGLARTKFEGQGSQSASLRYAAMVGNVVGEITQDQQLLQIAQALQQKQQPQEQQPPQGLLAGALQ